MGRGSRRSGSKKVGSQDPGWKGRWDGAVGRSREVESVVRHDPSPEEWRVLEEGVRRGTRGPYGPGTVTVPDE